MKWIIPALFFCLAAALVPPSAFAAEPKLIASHGAWTAYVIAEKAGKTCYMMGLPSHKEGKVKGHKRGDAYVLITDRPSERTRNVFTTMAGYSYKRGSMVSVSIDGGKAFTLFTRDDSAWAPTAETDTKIASVLRRGKAMTIHGMSSKGSQTTDTYDLQGAYTALQDVRRACGEK